MHIQKHPKGFYLEIISEFTKCVGKRRQEELKKVKNMCSNNMKLFITYTTIYNYYMFP